jgi:hypothetical protein
VGGVIEDDRVLRLWQIGDLQQVLGAEIGDDQGRVAGDQGFDRARDIAAGRHHDLLQLILLSRFTEY